MLNSYYLFSFLLLCAGLGGCVNSAAQLHRADEAAREIIARKQMQALGHTEPFTVELPEVTLRRRLLLGQNLPYVHPGSLGTKNLEPIPHWPDDGYLGDGETHSDQPAHLPALQLDLFAALQVAARNSREYQSAKEQVFRQALALDLERNTFRSIFSSEAQSELSTDLGGRETVTGSENSLSATLNRTFKTGAALTTRIAFDLVKLLTQDRSSSLGVLGDASIAIPLLRGAGAHIVAEPLTQAERDVVYAIWEFERFKRTFAVGIASEYLAVLRQLDQVDNAEENYRRLVASTRRARRLADAGRLPEIQVDQAVQNELRARDRWVSARQGYARSLDGFKITLGLPPDAEMLLERDELERLARAADDVLEGGGEELSAAFGTIPPADAPVVLKEPGRARGGPYELEEDRALLLALGNRLDLQTAEERVFDAQRQVFVAADALQGELTLLGSASFGERRTLGSAGLPDAELRPEKGFYSALLSFDLPLERTAERIAYRNSYIALEQQVRDLQNTEDRVKLDVRDGLRDLLEFRETLQIQAQAVRVARRRVESTNLFLQAGRAEIRDLLEAQEALISAQNALTTALVNYRVAELALQRDMGVLQVDEKGLWTEYQPEKG